MNALQLVLHVRIDSVVVSSAGSGTCELTNQRRRVGEEEGEGEGVA